MRKSELSSFFLPSDISPIPPNQQQCNRSLRKKSDNGNISEIGSGGVRERSNSKRMSNDEESKGSKRQRVQAGEIDEVGLSLDRFQWILL